MTYLHKSFDESSPHLLTALPISIPIGLSVLLVFKSYILYSRPRYHLHLKRFFWEEGLPGIVGTALDFLKVGSSDD